VRKTATALCLALCLCVAGCSPFLERTYVVRAPHAPQKPEELPVGDVPVGSKSAVKSRIMQMMENGIEQRTLRAVDYAGDFAGDINGALAEIQNSEPLAAYAVSYFSLYESNILNRRTASIRIVYTGRNPSAVRPVSGPSAFQEMLREAHRAYADSLVLSISFYETDSAGQYDPKAVFDRIYHQYPAFSLEYPAISAALYPEVSQSGTSRILEIGLHYEQSQSTLRNMADACNRKIKALTETGPGAESDPGQDFLRLYNLLLETADYLPESNFSTAYDALVRGKANAKGLAMAFSALCQQRGLESRVIRGRKNQEEHAWNTVLLDGQWYHVDAASAVLLESDGGMTEYDWAIDN